jgi:hypothetical protein
MTESRSSCLQFGFCFLLHAPAGEVARARIREALATTRTPAPFLKLGVPHPVHHGAGDLPPLLRHLGLSGLPASVE